MAHLQRLALAELDQNADLEQRALVKRPPISHDQENEFAVQLGVFEGIYTWDEIAAVTNSSPTLLPAPAGGLLRQLETEDDFDSLDDRDQDDLGGSEDLAADEMVDETFEEEYGEEEEEGSEAGHASDYLEAEDGPELHIELAQFDPAEMGLKEINNLAHFGVSSHKPGNGVEELLSDDLERYWQWVAHQLPSSYTILTTCRSDGQQPHTLTIHFLRRVEIRAIRFYVDFQQDESYTPTHIIFRAGTGPHDLLQFAEMALANPSGWQDVPLVRCGGGVDGNSLCCWIVQMHIRENHQNGKDTHIRGIRMFALDEGVDGPVNGVVAEMMEDIGKPGTKGQHDGAGGPAWIVTDMFSALPDFMREPEIR
jgi:anaphase-promoting complex subunit 10